jgi:hypothetical protein
MLLSRCHGRCVPAFQVDLRAILAGPTGVMRDFGTRATGQHGVAPRKHHSVSRAWNLFDHSVVKFARSDRVKKITIGKPVEELAVERQGGRPHSAHTRPTWSSTGRSSVASPPDMVRTSDSGAFTASDPSVNCAP